MRFYAAGVDVADLYAAAARRAEQPRMLASFLKTRGQSVPQLLELRDRINDRHDKIEREGLQ